MKQNNLSKKIIYLLLILLILFFLIYCFTNLDNNYLITQREGFKKKKKSTSNKYGCNPVTITYKPFLEWLATCASNNKNVTGVKCMTNSYVAPDENTLLLKACNCLDAKYESETIANKKESSFFGCKIDDKCGNNKLAMKCFDNEEVENDETYGWTEMRDYDHHHSAECFPVKKSGIINRIKRVLGMDGDKTCNVPSGRLKEANKKKASME